MDKTQGELYLQYDVNKKQRDSVIDDVRRLLNTADGKLTGKEIKRVISSLNQYNKLLEDVLFNTFDLITKISNTIAHQEVMNFMFKTHIRTLEKILLNKELATKEEIQQIHDDEIVPEEMSRYQTSDISEIQRSDG